MISSKFKDKSGQKATVREPALKLTSNQEEYSREEQGASLVEYVLLAALIVIVAFTAVQVFGNKVSQQFSVVADVTS